MYCTTDITFSIHSQLHGVHLSDNIIVGLPAALTLKANMCACNVSLFTLTLLTVQATSYSTASDN